LKKSIPRELLRELFSSVLIWDTGVKVNDGLPRAPRTKVNVLCNTCLRSLKRVKVMYIYGPEEYRCPDCAKRLKTWPYLAALKDE